MGAIAAYRTDRSGPSAPDVGPDCPSIADRRSTPSRADRGVCSGAIASERSSPPSREKGHGGVSELHGAAEIVVRSAAMGAITTRPVSVYTEVNTPVSGKRAEWDPKRAWSLY